MHFCLVVVFVSALPLILPQVEVAFAWPWNAGAQGPAQAGQDIAHSSLAIGIGTATCVAAYLTILFAIKLQALEDVLLSSCPEGLGHASHEVLGHSRGGCCWG